MYFAIDLDKRVVQSDKGEVFSVNQFKRVLERSKMPIDMTLMCQRFVNYDFDFDKLLEYYEG